ncbi:MAG TPA: sulfite exporter TauE/SafE family protein [Trueperaceae bacterium]|nr:sulfite exporter TauE/SafE family protein [Trueperaceae bacterium]
MPLAHVLTSSTPMVAVIAVGAAGIVTGLTGFGFALVSVPILMLVLPPASVVATVLVIGEITDVVNVMSARRHVDHAVLRGLLLPATLGMLLGAAALHLVPPAGLRLTAAAAVVTFTGLLLRRGRGSNGTGPGWRTLAASVSGLLTTAVGLSGPPIVLYLDAAMRDKHRSRATLAAYFAAISPAGLALVVAHGGFPAGTWPPILYLTPVALLGRTAGSVLHRWTTPQVFRTITLAVTLIAGLSGAFSALVALLYRA